MDVWKSFYITQHALLSFRAKVGSVLFLIMTCETSRKRSAFEDALQAQEACSLEISKRSHPTPVQQHQRDSVLHKVCKSEIAKRYI